MPQPTDLRNPIPGQSDMTMNQIFGAAPTNPAAGMNTGDFLSPGRAPASAPMQPTPMPNTSPQPSPSPSGDPLAAFGDTGTDPASDPFAVFDQAGQADPNPAPNTSPVEPAPGDPGAGFMARLRAGLGRTPKEQASLFEQSFGKENVKIRSGKIYFRKEAGGRFQSVEPEDLGFFADLFSDLADNSGAILEAGAAVPFEAAGALAGAAGGAAGGPPGVGYGAAAGVMTGAALGGVAGADLRAQAIQSAGGTLDPEVSLNQERLYGATGNVVGMGAGAVLKMGAQKVVGVLEWAAKEAPINRIKAIAEIKNAFTDLSARYRPSNRAVTASDVTDRVVGAAEHERNILNTQVELSRETVIERAGEQKFEMRRTMGTLKEMIEEQGGTFEKDGTARLSGSQPDQTFRYPTEVQRPSSLVDAQGQPLIVTETKTASFTIPGDPIPEPLKPFGITEGGPLLDRLVSDYNRLLTEGKAGGVSAKDLYDVTSFYQDSSGFEKTFGTRATTVARKIGYAAATDRDLVAAAALRGHPQEQLLTRAFNEYYQRTDALKKIEKTIRTQQNPELVAQAIVRPKRAQDIRDFKRLFGDGKSWDSAEGPVWNTVKSHWIDSLVQSHTDEATGLINAPALLKKMKGYGDETLREVFEPGELGEMRKLALQASKIQTSDLKKRAGFANFGQSIASLAVYKNLLPINQARVLWNLTRSQPQAADYLMDEGFMQMVRSAPSGSARTGLAKMVSEYRSLYDTAILRTTAGGKKAYVNLPKAGAAATARNLPGAMSRDEDRTSTMTGASSDGADYDEDADFSAAVKKAMEDQ